MNRFQKKRRVRTLLGRLLPTLFFLAVLALFWVGLEDLSGITARQEAEGLANTVRQSAVHCYAIEGFYPDSIAYLEDHYGLQYDKDKYLISYEVFGSNLMPDISVIRLS